MKTTPDGVSRIESIRAMREAGRSYAEIGRAHGVTRQRVEQIINGRRPVPSPRGQTVYIIQAGAHIKIGVASSVSRRLQQLQAGSPIPIRLLGTLSGGRTQERAIHAHCAPDRLWGEWFTPTRTVRDCLATYGIIIPRDT